MNATALADALGRAIIGRDRFSELIGDAVAGELGFATGKAGNAERRFLRYPIDLGQDPDPMRQRVLTLALAHEGLRHAGIFPNDRAFLTRFASSFAESVGELDVLGVFDADIRTLRQILDHYGFAGELISWRDQEPDRSSPADDDQCWLRHLAGRRVLLVSPFAEVLRERANRETFEAVWSKTGKRWFEPRSVDAVEFPYGFSPSTWKEYPDALALREEIASRIDRHDYDVAIISAGGLGMPIAAHVKRRGRVGISLGGHLQIVFGVYGKRWIDRHTWRERYFNDAWIRVPQRYRPDARVDVTAEDYW